MDEGNFTSEDEVSETPGSEDDSDSNEDASDSEESSESDDELDQSNADVIEESNNSQGNDVEGHSARPSDSDGEGEFCPICLNHFIGQELGTPEECNHIFCLDCIVEWSKNTNVCPIDRQEFNNILVRLTASGDVVKKVKVKVMPREVEESLPEDVTACEICQRGDREDRLLLCDSCDLAYHCECLSPPLRSIPIEEWFCPPCSSVLNRTPKVPASRNTTPRRVIPRTRVSETVRMRIQNERTQAVVNLSNPRPSSSRASAAAPKKRRVVRRKKYRRRKMAKPKVFARTVKSVSMLGKGKMRAPVVTKTRRRRRRKYKKRKSTTKKTTRTKRSRFASKPLAAPSVKRRIANHLGLCEPLPGHSAPSVKKSSGKTQEPTLSIFGNRNQLMDFDENYVDDGPSTSTGHRGNRSVQNSFTPIDILSDIMTAQNILRKPSKDIKIGRDGSLKLNSPSNSSTVSSSPSNWPDVKPSIMKFDLEEKPSNVELKIKQVMPNVKQELRQNIPAVKSEPITNHTESLGIIENGSGSMEIDLNNSHQQVADLNTIRIKQELTTNHDPDESSGIELNNSVSNLGNIKKENLNNGEKDIKYNCNIAKENCFRSDMMPPSSSSRESVINDSHLRNTNSDDPSLSSYTKVQHKDCRIKQEVVNNCNPFAALLDGKVGNCATMVKYLNNAQIENKSIYFKKPNKYSIDKAFKIPRLLPQESRTDVPNTRTNQPASVSIQSSQDSSTTRTILPFNPALPRTPKHNICKINQELANDHNSTQSSINEWNDNSGNRNAEKGNKQRFLENPNNHNNSIKSDKNATVKKPRLSQESSTNNLMTLAECPTSRPEQISNSFRKNNCFAKSNQSNASIDKSIRVSTINNSFQESNADQTDLASARTGHPIFPSTSLSDSDGKNSQTEINKDDNLDVDIVAVRVKKSIFSKDEKSISTNDIEIIDVVTSVMEPKCNFQDCTKEIISQTENCTKQYVKNKWSISGEVEPRLPVVKSIFKPEKCVTDIVGVSNMKNHNLPNTSDRKWVKQERQSEVHIKAEPCDKETHNKVLTVQVHNKDEYYDDRKPNLKKIKTSTYDQTPQIHNQIHTYDRQLQANHQGVKINVKKENQAIPMSNHAKVETGNGQECKGDNIKKINDVSKEKETNVRPVKRKLKSPNKEEESVKKRNVSGSKTETDQNTFLMCIETLVKQILKPFYIKKDINKEMYKEIMKKCVPKIMKNSSNGVIKTEKVKHLVISYVKIFMKSELSR